MKKPAAEQPLTRKQRVTGSKDHMALEAVLSKHVTKPGCYTSNHTHMCMYDDDDSNHDDDNDDDDNR
eukprot:4515834-Karenia_brevis.AAC.1